MSPTHQDRAVVLGGSIAGLLAARVLADVFAEVVVVDRDPVGPRAEPRRGTPQARHLHGLLARGHQVLEELFPGLTAGLVADGALVGDMLGSTRVSFGGHRFRPGPSGLTALCTSRPALEAEVRRRVAALPEVTLHRAARRRRPRGEPRRPAGRRCSGDRARRRQRRGAAAR